MSAIVRVRDVILRYQRVFASDELARFGSYRGWNETANQSILCRYNSPNEIWVNCINLQTYITRLCASTVHPKDWRSWLWWWLRWWWRRNVGQPGSTLSRSFLHFPYDRSCCEFAMNFTARRNNPLLSPLVEINSVTILFRLYCLGVNELLNFLLSPCFDRDQICLGELCPFDKIQRFPVRDWWDRRVPIFQKIEFIRWFCSGHFLRAFYFGCCWVCLEKLIIFNPLDIWRILLKNKGKTRVQNFLNIHLTVWTVLNREYHYTFVVRC